MKWIKHNSDCIKTDKHMVCKITTRTGLYYTTYTINKGVIKPTNRSYDNPVDAKRAITGGVA